MVFTLETEQGKLASIKYINDISISDKYEVIVRKRTIKRTVLQNSLMWMWFECLAHETGTDRNDFYDFYRELFLSRTVTINGKETAVSSGTSKLDTKQFTEFLNKIQADAASEFGIKLPTPEDMYWEEFANEYKK